jgi:hypothetical protein
MFAIMLPVLVVPAIWTLYRIQGQADELGATSFGEAGMSKGECIKVRTDMDYFKLTYRNTIDIDRFRLIRLISVSHSCCCLSISPTLRKSACP